MNDSGRVFNISLKGSERATARAASASDQTLRLEEAGRYLLNCFLVDIHGRVQLRHDRVVELSGEAIEDISKFRILVERLFSDHGCERIAREKSLVISQHNKFEG